MARFTLPFRGSGGDMARIGENEHKIYKSRGRQNIQIGLILGAFVLIVMIATIFKLEENPPDWAKPQEGGQAAPASQSQDGATQ